MRRFLASLAAALFCLAQAAQAQLIVTELAGFGASGETPLPVLSFLQCASSDANATSYTYSAQNVGTASASRATIVGIAARDSATLFTVSTVTVGGDSATSVKDDGGAQQISSALFIVANPAGTSEDVVVTFSEAVTSASICLWAVTDLSSLTAVATANASNGTGAALTLDVNTSAYGIIASMCGVFASGGTVAPTGSAIERADADTAEIHYAAYDYTEGASGASPRSFGCDNSLSNSTSGVSASFR